MLPSFVVEILIVKSEENGEGTAEEVDEEEEEEEDSEIYIGHTETEETGNYVLLLILTYDLIYTLNVQVPYIPVHSYTDVDADH